MNYNKKCRWFSMEYVGNPGAVPSCNRDAVLEVFDCSTCEENPNNAKRTNADRIRAMTDAELAEFFQNTTFCDSCFIYKNECGTESYSCIQRWLDWLRQEVDDG